MGRSVFARPLRESAFGVPNSTPQFVTAPSGALHVEVEPAMRVHPLHLRHGAAEIERLVGVELRGESMMGLHRSGLRKQQRALRTSVANRDFFSAFMVRSSNAGRP